MGKMGDLKKIVTAVAMSIVPTLQALVIPRDRRAGDFIAVITVGLVPQQSLIRPCVIARRS